ncbi:uncharacterized protein LOC129920403 [Episyrphus balteatus]|uniref:uncharacterized protein LOC129920403 n=1 Tax=Episyrphus balteatus TaxID=286459 RepID=UPI0024867A3A|nr:uncharacterized protein LOC129920403 [Episyrphus balteatus]
MIRKTWHKQIHRRKIWKTYSLAPKMWYYMKPFVIHLIMVFILFPIIYPTAILLATYWVFQFVCERDLGLTFPKTLDFHGYVRKVINTDPSREHQQVVQFHFEQFKIIAATIVTLIDYIRLATDAIFAL